MDRLEKELTLLLWEEKKKEKIFTERRDTVEPSQQIQYCSVSNTVAVTEAVDVADSDSVPSRSVKCNDWTTDCNGEKAER